MNTLQAQITAVLEECAYQERYANELLASPGINTVHKSQLNASANVRLAVIYKIRSAIEEGKNTAFC